MSCASRTFPSNDPSGPAAPRRHSPDSDRRRRAGLTLIEVLVVVIILAVLMTLVLTVVPRVRRSAQTAATQQMINALQAAIDQYHGDYRAYPGPLPDQVTYGLGTPPAGLTGVTMAENLTLGLLGGLRPVVSGGAVTINYDPARVGKGALNLSATNPSPPKVYLEAAAAREMISAEGAPFKDVAGRSANDSAVPEFIDRYPADPLPILYLRARPVSAGVMSDAATPGGGKAYQYDLRQITAYTGSEIGTRSGNQPHGLRTLGDSQNIPRKIEAAGPNEALRYFRAPAPDDASNPDPALNATSSPRQKDTYILISAGSDRVYGTADDVTSFGSVTP